MPYEVCERMRGSLFLVRSYFASGTGFLVRMGTLEGYGKFAVVATAHHNVAEAMQARAEVLLYNESSGTSFTASPQSYEIAQAGDLDVAFCTIFNENLPNLPVMESGPDQQWLKGGADVYWMGYPGLVEQYAKKPTACVFAGICSGRFAVQRSKAPGSPPMQTMYVLDGTVLPGCSGGPAFTRTGQVIGVVVAHGAQRDEAGALLTTGVTLAIPLWEALGRYLDEQPEPESGDTPV